MPRQFFDSTCPSWCVISKTPASSYVCACVLHLPRNIKKMLQDHRHPNQFRVEKSQAMFPLFPPLVDALKKGATIPPSLVESPIAAPGVFFFVHVGPSWCTTTPVISCGKSPAKIPMERLYIYLHGWWLMFMVNVGKYIYQSHGSFGIRKGFLPLRPPIWQVCFLAMMLNATCAPLPTFGSMDNSSPVEVKQVCVSKENAGQVSAWQYEQLLNHSR